MKRSMKLTVRRISCLIMVCALLVNSYPIQTMAAETDVQTVSSVQEAVADNQSASDNTMRTKRKNRNSRMQITEMIQGYTRR